jgi:hypothetical protein
MSWGALNNQKNRKSTDPLPGFLTGNSSKSFIQEESSYGVYLDPLVAAKTAFNQELSGNYVPRQGGNLNIPKRVMFALMFFFTFCVLSAFSLGYFLGQADFFGGKSTSLEGGLFKPTMRRPLVPAQKTRIPAMSEESDLEKAPNPTEATVRNENVTSEKNNNNEKDDELDQYVEEDSPESN